MEGFFMKNIFKLSIISSTCGLMGLFFAQNAHAVGSAGCGLGSVVFSSNTWWKQELALTTNGTFLSQTFGITSGTSNCAPGLFGQIQKQKDFVAANLSSLQREAALGTGDSLNGLATVLGCNNSNFETFSTYTQSHYASEFSSNSPDTVLDNIKAQVKKDSLLSNACPLASI